jgi:NADPH:quinone reductase-like Zn-dependent oxidoreductase
MAGTLPKTMKACIVHRAGKARDVLSLDKRWPMPPAPRAGEIMMRVSYASINPADVNLMGTSIPFRRNAIPAMDFVGQVVQTGPLSSSVNAPYTATTVTSASSPGSRGVPTIGTTVAGTVPLMSALRGVGSLAEYLTLPAHAVARKPDAMDEAVAAGLMGVAGQTSVALLRAAKLREGSRVLVNGASGGVGSVLVQVLNAMGMRVTGVCSGKNVPLVQTLGAQEVCDLFPIT